jgi:hypothetical protein
VHIELRSIYPNPGSDNYSDVIADGNSACIASWHYTSGVLILDVSNPHAPKLGRPPMLCREFQTTCNDSRY